MTAGVFGELTADGQRIALVVTGDDHELDVAAGALKKITPLISKAEVRGALYVPATWAAVTQIAHTFNGYLGQWVPGPRLSQWILEEFTRRTAVSAQPAGSLELSAEGVQPAVPDEPAATELQPATPLQLKPRPYQLEGARMIATAGKFLLLDDPGLGKTATAILGLRPRENIFPLVIVVPSWDVADAWAREIRAWAPEWPEPALYGGPGREELLAASENLPASRGKHAAISPKTAKPQQHAAEEARTAGEHEHAAIPHETAISGKHAAIRHEPASAEQHAARCLQPANGNQQHAAAATETARTHGILITTYATARIDAADMHGPLVKLRARSVVADEVHFLKNAHAKQSAAVKRVAARADVFLGLSGTPVTRDTGDFYSILEAMSPADWPSEKRFRDRYLDITGTEYAEKVEGLNRLAEPEFRAVLLGQLRRAAKGDVLEQLPPKVYSVRRVGLPPEWRRAYDTLEKDMLAELPDGGELPVMSVLAQLTRLSQLASSAFDVTVTEDGEGKKQYDVALKAPSWKADALLEILAERRGHPVAAFTVSRQLADICGKACEEAGLRVCYITGTVPKKARQQAIDDFQSGTMDVILLTAKAGGLGITLTAAGTVVMLQRDNEYDKAVQPEDRAHRIGQEHDCVEIIDVVAKDTADERVRELTRVKGRHLGQLVQDERIARELLGGLR